MDLEKLELDMQQNMNKEIKDHGYLILKGFFPKERIQEVLENARRIFEIQFERKKYSGEFKEKMIRLFSEDPETFQNCGKMIQQGLLQLYSLCTDEKLIGSLKGLGLEFPLMCTRPVLFFNHPSLAKEEVYYKTPLHQDWPSMEASLDSLVVWIPLVDVNKNNGSIIIYPGSHTLGNISDSIVGGFASIDEEKFSWGNEVQLEAEAGDIVIFSSFLVHKSGEILDDEIRWSCHLRYTNMMEKDFISRGFPHPYIYKPTLRAVTKI